MNTTKKTNLKMQQVGKYILFADQIIGKGATSIVYKGEVGNSTQMVAIKVIDLSHNSDVAQRSLLQNECKALRQLNHPNILKLCDIIEIDRKFYIITKYYEGHTLAELLIHQSLNQQEIASIFGKVLEAITYLINKNIIHRDLKPSNIIIDKHQIPIIIDFGFCQIIHEAKISRVFNVGSPSYMAPEAYLRTLYSEKSESWSLGMILYEMLYRRTLDKGLAIKQFYQKVRCDENYIGKQIGIGLAAQLEQIIEKSLKYNSIERISITGMKYQIDLLIIKHKKGDKKVINSHSTNSIPSIIKFNHSKHKINFNQEQAPQPQPQAKKIKFQQPPISPMKKRDISIKFIKSEQGNHPARSEQIPKSRFECQNNMLPAREAKQINTISPCKDYFSNKIKKGVFDVKRFSQTQRQILSPHLDLNKHHQLSIKQL